MKEFFGGIIYFCSNLKLSIDIYIMSVRKIFAEFRFTFKKPSCSRPRRQKAHPIYFLYFTKAQSFLDIVSGHK